MTFSVMYNFVRSRQLEDTYPGSPEIGIWLTTSLRVSKGWGILRDVEWPYDGDARNWPPIEPKGIDQKAKEIRFLAYQRVSTIDECRILLASGYPIMAGFEIDDTWNDAQKGIIPSTKDNFIIGAHTIDLIGYDDEQHLFKFRNSWGTSWGDKGYGLLPYDYFPDRFIEGWSIIGFEEQKTSGITSGKVLQNWGINDLFGNILHCAEIFDSTKNEMIAWGFMIERKTSLDLEEIFVRPKWRRQGYSSQLTKEFVRLSSSIGKELRAWIPHSDFGKVNQPALNAVLQKFNLSIHPSPVRWAAAIGR